MSILGGLVTPVPESLESGEKRRRHRDLQASRTTGAGLVAKVLYLFVRLASVPLSLRFLGADRYGLWLAAGSLVNWIGLFELGIGSGLVNALSSAAGHSDFRRMREHISTGLMVAFALCGFAILLIVATAHWSGLAGILGVANRPDLRRDGQILVLIAGCCFACSIVTNVMNQIWLGLHHGYFGQIAFMSGTVLSLGLLVVLTQTGATLQQFALAMGTPVLLAYLALGIYFFGRRMPWLRPKPDAFRFCSLKLLGGTGLFLTIAQGGDLVILCTSNLLIASQIGPREVPRFAVAYSLLMFLQSVCLQVIQPRWPAYSEAIALGEWPYVRRTFRRTVLITFAIMASALACFGGIGRWFIRLWAGEAAVPPVAAVALLCVWFLIWTWNQNVNIAVNALAAVRTRALGSCVAGVCFLVTAVAMLPRIGVAAMPLAGCAAALGEAACTTPVLMRRIQLAGVAN
jgi:O-antigen/teichoic acid export membrane protein